jgi:Cof subfamily protein (haloacid dehalogenase superfamily)
MRGAGPERPARETHEREAGRSPIELVVSDVDGTLLTDEKKLPDANCLAVQRLSAAGIGFTLVSARPPIGLIALARSLRLSLPYGACNGAAICLPNGRVLQSRPMPRVMALRILCLLDEMRVSARMFVDNGWFVTDPNGPYVAYEANVLGHQPNVVPSLVDAPGDCLKIVGASDDFDQLRTCEQRLRREVPEVEAVRSRPFFLDVTAAAVTKGRFVLDIAKFCALDPARVAVVGDMNNDIPMFEVAGRTIAVANASPELKARAQYVTLRSNNEGGFAEGIEALLVGQSTRTSSLFE